MESFKRIFKKTTWFSILESIMFALLGTILVCKPEGTMKLITTILGTIFIITGIYKIIIYFATKGVNDFFNYDLIFGLTSIVIGVVSMVYLDVIGSIFRIIIGIWIIYSSFVRINSAVQIRSIGNKSWIYGLILAIIMFACGLYILVNKGAIIVTIGTIMIIFAIIDIIENLIFMKNVNKTFQ